MSTLQPYHHEAQGLLDSGNSERALLVLLKGVSQSPSDHQGRLLLARVFHSMGMTPLAVRELQHLIRELPDMEILRRLVEALSPGASVAQSPQASTSTVAEAEFDIDLLSSEPPK